MDIHGFLRLSEHCRAFMSFFSITWVVTYAAVLISYFIIRRKAFAE